MGSMPTTRLAPSPTGALHLGNARTFLVNWLLARQRGWRIVLRIEDLDGPRIKPGADRQAIEVTAHCRGPRRFDVARQLGDLVVAKNDGTPAYQLAVVVDDADMHVTDVVRGDDLIDSTPRQLLLYEALGLKSQIPNYYHLP